MGGYQLIDNTLHYTGDGWVSVELTTEQIEQLKQGVLEVCNLDWE